MTRQDSPLKAYAVTRLPNLQVQLQHILAAEAEHPKHTTRRFACADLSSFVSFVHMIACCLFDTEMTAAVRCPSPLLIQAVPFSVALTAACWQDLASLRIILIAFVKPLRSQCLLHGSLVALFLNGPDA